MLPSPPKSKVHGVLSQTNDHDDSSGYVLFPPEASDLDLLYKFVPLENVEI